MPKVLTEFPQTPRSERALWQKYRMTLDDYNRIKDEQNHRCKICGCLDERLVVDHCHITEEVRGLLCNNCNSGLAFFGDSSERMIRAIEYLGQKGTY